MRAVVLVDEAASSTELVELEKPEPGEGEIRVKVAAASVNGFDLAVAAGHTKGLVEQAYPTVLGKDFAGTVDALGAGVSEYSVGDRVFGTVTKPVIQDGSFAEYVTVPVGMGVARLPKTVSFVNGAALGLAGSAAYAAFEGAQIGLEHTVLVVGATGGVGQQVVQLAAATGATVTATAMSAAGAAAVTGLGASRVIDPADGDVAAQTRRVYPEGVDVVVRLAGDVGVVSAVREGGTFVSTLVYSPEQVPNDAVSVVPVMAAPTPDRLTQIAADHAEGRTKVSVQATYTLDQVPEAFAAFAAGTLGKLVVTVAE